MLKRLRQGPSLPEILQSRYHKAQVELLDAQTSFEDAKANLQRHVDRVQRLKETIEEAK